MDDLLGPIAPVIGLRRRRTRAQNELSCPLGAPDPMKIMVACLHHCWRRDDVQRIRSPAPMLHSFSRDNFVRSMRSMRSMGSMEAPTDRLGPNFQRNPPSRPSGRKSRERTQGAGGATTGLRERTQGHRVGRVGTDWRNCGGAMPQVGSGAIRQRNDERDRKGLHRLEELSRPPGWRRLRRPSPNFGPPGGRNQGTHAEPPPPRGSARLEERSGNGGNRGRRSVGTRGVSDGEGGLALVVVRVHEAPKQRPAGQPGNGPYTARAGRPARLGTWLAYLLKSSARTADGLMDGAIQLEDFSGSSPASGR